MENQQRRQSERTKRHRIDPFQLSLSLSIHKHTSAQASTTTAKSVMSPCCSYLSRPTVQSQNVAQSERRGRPFSAWEEHLFLITVETKNNTNRTRVGPSYSPLPILLHASRLPQKTQKHHKPSLMNSMSASLVFVECLLSTGINITRTIPRRFNSHQQTPSSSHPTQRTTYRHAKTRPAPAPQHHRS